VLMSICANVSCGETAFSRTAAGVSIWKNAGNVAKTTVYFQGSPCLVENEV